MKLNNELMVSYIDANTNKLVTVYYTDVNDSDAKITVPSNDKIFDDINPCTTYGNKKGNYNPSNPSDPYGLKSNKRLLCSSDHSVTDNDDRGDVNIRWFDTKPLYYYGSPTTSTLYAYRTFTTDGGKDQYIVGSAVHLNDNKYYSDMLFSNVSSEDGSYATQSMKGPDSEVKREYFPMILHDNMDITFGNRTLSENPSESIFHIIYTSGNVQDNIRKDGGGALAPLSPTITQRYNNQNATIAGTPEGLKSNFQRIFTQAGDGYQFITHWNNGEYAITTNGHTLKADDYILSGEIGVYAKTHLGNIPIAMSGESVYFQFSSPTTRPTWYYESTSDISGYYSGRRINTFIEDDITLDRSYVWYNDENHHNKTIDIKNGSQLDFRTSNANLNGKNMNIKASYKTIAGVENLQSEYICPSFFNYFDVDDVVLTLSGIKYDKGLSSNISYEVVYLKEENNKVLYNKIASKFQTIEDINVRLDFTLRTNTIDLDSNTRIYSPAPETVWLIAVPKTAITDNDVRYAFFNVSDSFSLGNRDTYDKTTKFPKVSTYLSKTMADLCSGSPGVPTSDGIIWRSQNLSPIYDAASAGSFSENTYTINVGLNQGSWSFYLVIKDSTDTYTSYCISNYQKFDIPTSKTFEF